MLDVNIGVFEICIFGFFILGNYIKNKFENRVRNKYVQDIFQGSIHLGIALYTIYNINNNNTFNTNLLQESNKMFAHYGKNFNDIITTIKTTLEEFNTKNEKLVEIYTKINSDIVEEKEVIE